MAGGLGLRAEYFNNTTRSGSPALIRRDAPIDFAWGGITGPAPGINATEFSTRWTGFIEIPTAGTYTFYVASDDGVRLWINDVNGTPVVDQLIDRPETENATGTYTFTAGQRVPVRIDYYQNLGGAAMRLRWQGPGIAKAIIPAVSLFPPIDPQAAEPLILPGSGIYENGVTIQMLTFTPGATIRYTLDGSLPSATAGFVYGGAFTLTSGADVRAIAVKDWFTPSPVAFASFTILRPLPYWRLLHNLPSDGSQDLANPSGDGIANLLKYAFNMAYNFGDLDKPDIRVLPENGTVGLPHIYIDAQGRLVIESVRRKAATNPGVAYLVETGDDLANLQPLSLTGATVESIDAIWERVTVTDPVVTGKRFGRVRVLASDTYTNNFNAGLGAATLRRDAVWTNQAVQLTDALNGQFGAVVLDGIEAGPAVSGFTARFNATLGPTSNAPADGLSFSVGDLGTDAWAEAGPPTSHHLSIGFDTFDNFAGIPETVGIHLWVNGTHVAYNATNPYTDGVAVPVEVSYDTTTGVTVRFNGVLIFNNVPVPGFSFQTGDRFGFGGRTGGFNERKVIDDVEITTR